MVIARRLEAESAGEMKFSSGEIDWKARSDLLQDSQVNCDFRRCENVGEVCADREENPKVDRGAGFGGRGKIIRCGIFG